MKLPPFTLVYRPGLAAGKQGPRQRGLVDELEAQVKGLRSSLRGIDPVIRKALLGTVERSADRAGSADFVAQAVGELRRQAKVEKVGFWDLSSQVGELPRVVAALNAAQPVFAFFEVQAAVPSGLISRPERVVAWAEENLQKRLTKSEREEIGNNVIFEDFAQRARTVRNELGLDHLIGLAPAMVAFDEAGTLFWNYFSMSEPGIVLASTFDVSQFARKAGRPFEVAVAGIALSTLLAILSPELDFHEEVRGCLFDFNRERDTIVKALRRVTIEPTCLAKIRPEYRQAAEAMAQALRDLGTPPADGAAGVLETAAKRKGSSTADPLARPRGGARRSRAARKATRRVARK